MSRHGTFKTSRMLPYLVAVRARPYSGTARAMSVVATDSVIPDHKDDPNQQAAHFQGFTEKDLKVTLREELAHTFSQDRDIKKAHIDALLAESQARIKAAEISATASKNAGIRQAKATNFNSFLTAIVAFVSIAIAYGYKIENDRLIKVEEKYEIKAQKQKKQLAGIKTQFIDKLAGQSVGLFGYRAHYISHEDFQQAARSCSVQKKQ